MMSGQKMILVFQDDTTMRTIDSVAEANRVYETIDVENGEYTFLDARGYLLRPVIQPPPKKKFLWFFSTLGVEPFTLKPTNEKRDDLLAQLQSGEFTIDPRSAGIRTLADLRAAAPDLFSV